MTGPKRKTIQAQVAKDYLNGSPQRTERVFGWGRDTVVLGLHELRTGIICPGDFSSRGKKKEEKCPKLELDIRSPEES